MTCIHANERKIMKKLILFVLTLIILIGAFSKGVPNLYVMDDRSRLDTLLIAYLMNELGFDSTDTFIIRFTNELARDVNGIIKVTPEVSGKRAFHIWIRDGLTPDLTNHTLIHEFVHAFQYKEGFLVELDEFHFKWKSLTFDVRRTSYLQRPWEADAIYESNRLSFKYHTMLRKAL